MSDSYEKSEKESVQEYESDIGDDDFRAERRLDVAPAVATGGSIFPPDNVIRRAHPFPFHLPLYMLAETRRQHETTNQNETTNHDDERKLPAIPVREEEDDEALSRATNLTQNSVAGAIPPTNTAGCFRFGHLCVSNTLFKNKKTAFGEDFSRGMMPKKRPRREGEKNKEEVVDM
jgi:hypothetical protein